MKISPKMFLGCLSLIIILAMGLAAIETIKLVATIMTIIIAVLGTIAMLLALTAFAFWLRMYYAKMITAASISYAEAGQAQMVALALAGQSQLIATSHVMISEYRDMRFENLRRLPAPAEDQVLLPAATSMIFETIAKDALAGRGAGRFIAFGAMESGKTTIAKFALDYAIDEIVNRRGGEVFVIDPHAPETVWGDGITVVGAGMDYQGIRQFLDHMKADVKQRYIAGCGDDSHPLPEPFKPNFIVCEEWTGIISELQSKKLWDAEDNRTFYMDARKAGWGYFLVAHEYTVGALGLKGMGNLLSGVEYFITLEKNALTQQYSATIGNSFKDKSPYDLVTPGAYNGRMAYSSTQVQAEKLKAHKYGRFSDLTPAQTVVKSPSLTFVVVNDPPKPTEDEDRIIEAFVAIRDSGKFSWNKVVKMALGDGKTGVFYHKKIKKVLAKFDVDFSDLN